MTRSRQAGLHQACNYIGFHSRGRNGEWGPLQVDASCGNLPVCTTDGYLRCIYLIFEGVLVGWLLASALRGMVTGWVCFVLYSSLACLTVTIQWFWYSRSYDPCSWVGKSFLGETLNSFLCLLSEQAKPLSHTLISVGIRIHCLWLINFWEYEVDERGTIRSHILS